MRLAREARLGLTLLLVGISPAPATGQRTAVEINFLDVGQGDAIVIRAPTGQAVLVDAGPGVDIGPSLGRLGIDTLDLVVASHPHADHIGGMWEVLESVPVRFYMDNGQPHTTETYHQVMAELLAHDDVVYLEATPRTFSLGETRLHVLPLPTPRSSNLNDSSVGLVLEHGAFLAFLSGDSERPELRHFLDAGVVPDVTLLKAPHHGSDDALDPTFLETADPEVIVISVGRNSYGHPAPDALLQYGAIAEELYRTDRDGPVTVLGHVDGSYEVTTGALGLNGRMVDGTSTPVPPVPGAEPPVATTGVLSISVFADAPGNDHENRNGEYVVISNSAPGTVDIAGWTLCDLARHCFTFPRRAAISGGGRIVIYTGSGRSDRVRFFMGSGRAVWNNGGDTATLSDAEGRVVVTHVY